MECSEPWEVTLLKEFCKCDVSLEGVSTSCSRVGIGWYSSAALIMKLGHYLESVVPVYLYQPQETEETMY